MESVDPSRLTVQAPRGLVSRLRALESRVANSPAFFAAIFLALYGFSSGDFGDFRVLTSNPFVTHPIADRQFLHSSPLTIFIGWPLTHAVGPLASYLLVAAGGFALLLVALRLYLTRLPAERRSTILFVVLSTPILLVLFSWIGKNDPYLLAFFLLALTFGDKTPSALFSLLLVVSHRELGTIMLVGDAVLRRRTSLPILSGALAGNLLVLLYLASLTTPPFSRADVALAYLRLGIAGWERNALAHVLLALGWCWIFLLARMRMPDLSRVCVVLALCFGLSTGGADYTRVFILCAFPLVIYTAEHIAAAPELAAWVKKRPFPLAFLVQMQLQTFDQVRDTMWPHKLLPFLRHVWHLMQ